MKWMLKFLLIAVIALPIFAAEQSAATSTDQIQALDQQMRDLLQERETVLSQMRDDNLQAPLSERVAREAEYAQTQEDYQIQLLEMMVEYYGMTGNDELRARAEANLESMLAPVATGTPEPSSSNRAAHQTSGEER
ncbi:MAG: hypothetical protein KDB65_11860 [Calditrichaeota bacterium]|nr:hypothetical protein [Calditrichota bacterium]MCB9368945.1 hypothetical protein [Calditrichota bacterium]